MSTPRYDLEERTAQFGESAIDFAKAIPVNLITTPLISQLVRTSTSVGVNYGEADNASSEKNIKHSIRICQRESKETKHGLRMISRAEPQLKDNTRRLWQEGHELLLIFSAIIRWLPRKWSFPTDVLNLDLGT